MHIAEVVTIAKSLPLLRLNTYKSLILSYSADYKRIFRKRHRFLLLHVYEKNSRAVAFYRREGFECRDRHVEEDTGEMEWTMAWMKENIPF